MAGRKIRKKLNSTHGTSIFFGILFFMIASILSIVMLNGAVTAVKRVQSDKQAEQNYLTCSSAAKLLRNEIEKTAIIRKRTQTWREYDQTPNGDTIEWNSDSQTFGGIYLKDWIQNMTEDVTAGDTMTQTLQVCDSDGQLQNVTADFKITKDSSGENKFVDSEDRNRTYYSYDISINLCNYKKSEYKTVTEDGAAFIGQGIFVKYQRMGIIQYERVGKSSGKTYV